MIRSLLMTNTVRHVVIVTFLTTLAFPLFAGYSSRDPARVEAPAADRPSPTPTPTSAPISTPATIVDTTPEIVDTTPPHPDFDLLELQDAAFGTDDVDCDGKLNRNDNCVLVFNPEQKDRNNDGIGDACSGRKKTKLDFRCDGDSDGVYDRVDNCPLVCNPDQTDKNKNNRGDVCDPELLKEWVRIDPCSDSKPKRKGR